MQKGAKVQVVQKEFDYEKGCCPIVATYEVSTIDFIPYHKMKKLYGLGAVSEYKANEMFMEIMTMDSKTATFPCSLYQLDFNM